MSQLVEPLLSVINCIEFCGYHSHKAPSQHFNHVDFWILTGWLQHYSHCCDWDHCPGSWSKFSKALAVGQMASRILPTVLQRRLGLTRPLQGAQIIIPPPPRWPWGVWFPPNVLLCITDKHLHFGLQKQKPFLKAVHSSVSVSQLSHVAQISPLTQAPTVLAARLERTIWHCEYPDCHSSQKAECWTFCLSYSRW